MTSGTPPVDRHHRRRCQRLRSVSNRTKDTTLFLPQRYLTAIERAGAIPVILSPNRTKSAVRRLLGILNGLVLSGGNFDIHPRYYGERPLKELGEIKSATHSISSWR